MTEVVTTHNKANHHNSLRSLGRSKLRPCLRRYVCNGMKSLSLLPIVFVLSACVSINPIGSYSRGPWVEFIQIDIKEDNTFSALLWSDDGLDQCKAIGTWSMNGKVLETNVVERFNLSSYRSDSECMMMLRDNENWHPKSRKIINSNGAIFRKFNGKET